MTQGRNAATQGNDGRTGEDRPPIEATLYAHGFTFVARPASAFELTCTDTRGVTWHLLDGVATIIGGEDHRQDTSMRNMLDALHVAWNESVRRKWSAMNPDRHDAETVKRYEAACDAFRNAVPEYRLARA